MKYLIIFALFLSGCGMLGKKIEKPTVNLQSLDIEGKGDGANLIFGVHIVNPNKFPLKVDAVKYDLEVDGKPLTSGTLDQTMEVAASSASTLSVPIAVKYQDIFRSVAALLGNGQVPYNLKGSARFGVISVPFTEVGNLKFAKGKLTHEKTK